jgi:hypothetical protein
MDVSYHKLYLYDHVWQLLAVGDALCPSKDNGPMNNSTPLKAHKGLDNKLLFRVLDPDRVPVSIPPNQRIYARIIDPSNRTVALEKLCRYGPAKGLITLELDGGDIIDLAPGYYEVALIRIEEFVEGIPGYNMEKPLYTDLNDDVVMKLEITEQAFKAPVDAITVYPHDWIKDILVPTFGPPAPCFYTSRIPGARILNHKESVHTFSTFTKNATGILEIWGTLEETPDPYLSESRWFKIYPSSMSVDIEFFGYSGTQAWSFQANVMWIKFRYFPSQQVLDPGILEKLVVRT